PRAAEHFKKARAAYGRALDEYTRAAEWYPAEPKYDYNRGNALVKLGREEEALGAYAKAWTLDPRYAEAYFNGAIAAYHLGQYQRAGGYFQRVLDIDPRYPQAREDLDTLVGRGWYHP
ncbi:MAG TPA: tetratricopeptide repeat protein, partial [bacterium]|nr:tetratricopeptide repeat protein [bacterium]